MQPNSNPSREARLDVAVAEYYALAEAGSFEREAFLARHPDLRPELESFLANNSAFAKVVQPASDVGTGEFTPQSLMSTQHTGQPVPMAEPVGDVRTVGGYEIVGEIARGGMGVVFRAKQSALGREVALKTILTGANASPLELERFRAEAEAAARLDHPNIIPIYEVGTHAGLPYFSMKLVEGGSLSGELKKNGRGEGERLRKLVACLEAVARAVHHAHQRGILHRDLKPANVLLDAAGVPVVTDFGLARRVEADSALTQSGAILGTPSYMPPEQALGHKNITTAADVYSLGAILYEILTGRAPFKSESVLETLQAVVASEPTPPRQLVPGVDRDLETIALKCLEKDPVRRYGSADALADDLRRWQAGEPILARPTGSLERLGKLVRRRPVVAGLVATVFAMFAIGTPILFVNWRSAVAAEAKAVKAAKDEKAARNAADDAKAVAQKLADDEKAARKAADEARAAAIKSAEQEKTARKAAEDAKAVAVKAAALEKAAKDATVAALAVSFGQRLAANADAVRPSDPGLALNLAIEAVKRTPNHLTFSSLYAAMRECRELMVHTSARNPDFNSWHIYEGNFSAGEWATADEIITAAGASLRRWNASTGKVIWEWKGWNLTIKNMRLTADGSRLVVTCHGYAPVRHADGTTYNYTDRVAYVVDAKTGQELRRVKGAPDHLVEADFSPDGKYLVTGCWDGAGRLHEVESGKLLHTLRIVRKKAAGNDLFSSFMNSDRSLMAARFSPDGKLALTLSSMSFTGGFGYDQPMWGMGDKKKIPTDPDPDPLARPEGPSGFGSGGMTLGGQLSLGDLWDTTTGKRVGTLLKLPRELLNFNVQWQPHGAVFSPDSQFIAVAVNNSVCVWKTTAAIDVLTLAGHTSPVQSLAYSPNGKQLATASADGTARIWDIVKGREMLRLTGHAGAVRQVQWDGAGKRLLTAGDDKTARVWDVATGKELAVLRGAASAITHARFSPDGTRALVLAGDTARLFTLEAPKMPDVVLANHSKELLSLSYSPDGKRFLTSSKDGTAKLWDVATSKLLFSFGDQKQLGAVKSARFSPDGKRIVTASENRSNTDDKQQTKSAVNVWDAETGKELVAMTEMETGALAAEFSPDGKRIVTIGDGAKRMRSKTGSGIISAEIKIENTASTEKGTVEIWDAATGKRLATLNKPTKSSGWIHDIAVPVYSPDGKYLIAIDYETQLPMLFETASGKKINDLVRTGRQWGESIVGFSPDSSFAIVAKGYGMATFDLVTGNIIGEWSNFPGAVTSFAFNADGSRLVTVAGITAHVWNPKTRELVQTIRGYEGDLKAVTISPNGQRLLTSGADGSASLWDLATGRLLTVLQGHAGDVTHLAFRHDGKQIATGGVDGTARLWPLDVLPHAQTRLPRGLTDAERRRYDLLAPEGGRNNVPKVEPAPGAKPISPYRPDPTPSSPEAAAILAANPDAAGLRRLIVKYPGTPEAVQAAGRLAKMPSPLDALKLEQTPAANRPAQAPPNLVAVLGETRQRVANGINDLHLSPSGKLLVSYDSSESYTIWDTATMTKRGQLNGSKFVFDANNDIAHVGGHQWIATYDLTGEKPKELRKFSFPNTGFVIGISPDGKYAVLPVDGWRSFGLYDLTGEKPTSKRIFERTNRDRVHGETRFSPDGTQFALEFNDDIWLFDTKTGQRKAVLPPQSKESQNHSPMFSLDGKTLFVGSWKILYAYRLGEKPEVLWKVTAEKGWFVPVRQSADGKKLLVRHNYALHWYDLTQAKPTAGPALLSNSSHGRISQDEQFLYASNSRAVRKFALKDGKYVEQQPVVGHKSDIYGLAFSHDDRVLVSADDDEYARIWNITPNGVQPKPEMPVVGSNVLFTPAGKLIAGSSMLNIWDVMGSKPVHEVKGLGKHEYSGVGLSLSGDGRLLVRYSRAPDLSLWDMSQATPREIARIAHIADKDVYGSVRSAALSPDGKFLAGKLYDYNDHDRKQGVRLWRVGEKSLETLRIPHRPGSQLAFSPDGRTLAVSERGTVELWDMTDAKLPIRKTWKVEGVEDDGWSNLSNLQFSPDGQSIAATIDRRVFVWTTDGKSRLDLKLPNSVYRLTFAHDSRHLAAGQSNSTIWLLRLGE